MKRLVLAVAAIVVVGVGAWLLAVRMESPQQAAARAEPPAPEPVVVALDRGYLNGPVSMTVEAQNQQSVVVTPPAALTGVVTSVDRSAGDTLSPGSVPFRVNGRPVFVLEGAFALYRDIRPGDEGDDVLALQKGLLAAGYALGRPDGKYGPQTQAAVRSMYRAAGYAAPEVAVAAPDAAAAPSPGASAPETTATGTGAAAPSDGTAVPAAGGGAAATVKGPGVLQSEVLTVPRLPAVVEGITTVGTGIAADTGLLTLGTGQVVLTSTLPQGSVGALAVDAAARFTDDSGAEATARVTALSPTETGEVTVSLLTEGAVRAGSSYVLTIDNPAAEDGERLLAPVAAVVTRAGRTYVYVREGTAFREVAVEVEATVGGVAAIVAADGDADGDGGGDAGVVLGAGTEVRVG
ncbi:peptidoglycan-binding domain-containing protein [Oerskovia sp. Root918]|uniref:peptidoglycan-binding domain-containing protein n=1 Tax=Oerskovia sp. Root918 TaxID=1736607 RepID=UPI0009E80BE1|nr:peptidoglycan-binding domain-containing protein [Oerskovia sp. Root918]